MKKRNPIGFEPLIILSIVAIVAIASIVFLSIGESINPYQNDLVGKVTNVLYSCVETDSGNDYFQAGSTQVLSSDGIVRTELDSCTPYGILHEWSCLDIEEGYILLDEYHACPSGCVGGACQLTAFVAAHMEVGPPIYMNNMWPVLADLVELADVNDFKLTLEFNPQWASYILADNSRLQLLRSWESRGHEIALHHHGPTKSTYWNGYTNREDMKTDPRYLGSINEMMQLMRKLPLSGNILTGGCSDEDTDWPLGVRFDTDGGANRFDLLSKPADKIWNEVPVKQLRYRMYATEGDDATLDEIESAYSFAKRGDIMGIVFHVDDYAKRPAEIQALFASFEQNNIQVRTVKSILGPPPVID